LGAVTQDMTEDTTSRLSTLRFLMMILRWGGNK
jgi:hypothetical protein